MILVEPGHTQWDLKWQMLRVPVRVHPLFWLITLAFSYDKNLKFSWVLALIGCFFVSILVHEFGHALSRRYFGDREAYVVLYQLGGLCVSPSERLQSRARIVTLLWGPGAGFILGALAYGVELAIRYRYLPYPGDLMALVIINLVWINLLWGLFNFVPVIPLDGGQIVREYVHWKMRARGDYFAFTISFYAGLLATGVALAYFFYMTFHGGRGDGIEIRNLWPVALFGNLAYNSYVARRQISLYGEMEDNEPRQPWQQDPDWWKK